jgi:membrane-bound lytic murein transglycosylase B
MKNIRISLPFICCISLFSCAQAIEQSNLSPKNTNTVATEITNTDKAAEKKPNPSPEQALSIISADEFAACINKLSQKAKVAGISDKIITENLAKANFNTRVIELDRKQPEFSLTFADYLNRSVTDQRVEQGRALMIKHRKLLDSVVKQYGVPAPYILAFWGLETNYGSFFGNMLVVDSLATLACDTQRSDFFAGELITALRILDEGAISPDKMVGSWAGAMGNFQFMPSAFLKNAVDYDGDNKRDIWNSTADAMASAEKYLQSLGWQQSDRWGREVNLPVDFPFLEAGLKNSKSLSDWRKLGVKQANGAPLPHADIKASLLVPSGYQGPAFLVYDNFNVIMHWNRSEFYALAVGILADRIAGGGKLVKSPPEDAPRLRREQVTTLQEQLNQKGFNTGTPDGIFGPGTRRAISEFQHEQGMIADGFPNKHILDLLGVDVDSVKN